MAKDVKYKNNRQDDFAETCSNIISGVVTIGVIVLLMVFPLIYEDAYFNILEVKYKCYYLSVLAMLAVVLVLAIVMAVIDAKEFQGEHVMELLSRLKPANWKKNFRVADAAVLIFWVVAVISTLQSDFVYESFWGNEGRYTGLFLLTLYVTVYFLVSRCWKVKEWCLWLFLASGMIMCVIGITDYFQMDILRFRVNIKPEQSTMFTSTVGNINTYTAYVGMVMGYAAGMFAVEKKQWKMMVYYVCMIVAFMAIIMGCSDNAYLGIAALFGLLPFVAFRSREGMKRYLIMLATFFSVVQCIDVINQKYEKIVIGLDSLFKVIVNFKGLLLIVILLWAVVAAFCFYEKKCSRENEDAWGTRAVLAWGIFAAAVILAVCFVLYDANAAGNGDRYGALQSYLVFSDSWGTNRGYIWRQSIELYKKFKPVHKVFGYGPDTFGILTIREIYADMVNATKQKYDSVHNEYLQYLVTIGPIGLAAYVTLLISSISCMLKRWKGKPYLLGIAFALLCYEFQAVVNINLPIAAPVMWLMMSIGMAFCRKRDEASDN